MHKTIGLALQGLIGAAHLHSTTGCATPAPLRCLIYGAALLLGTAQAQTGARGEWATHGGDLGNSRYAALNQINASNFSDLEVAWFFSTANLGPTPEYQFESTPLMKDGVLYSTGGTRRAVFALDAANGELLWVYSLDEGARGANAPRRLSGRGLSYWSDGDEARILYVTPGYRLIALDARTGKPVPTFGDGGSVDLKLNFDQDLDPETADVGLNSAPTVVEDVVIVGAAHRGGAAPATRENVKGYVRGFDVRSGARLWIFHTIPRPGQFGYDTWLDDSAAYTGNTGVWTQIAVDEDLGLAYLPVESPTGDYYGGTRPGDNLYGESIVAVDYKTGERRWHYQLVHHPIWDYDVSAPPMLVDVVKDGRTTKALAQATKQTYVYVLDRATGEPVFPIPERTVPAGNVPGEWYSPTQPIPSIAVGREQITEDDLIDFTPELRAAALDFIEDYELGHLYTPPLLSTLEGPRAALLPMGGTNWPGGAYDPVNRLLFVPASANVRTMSNIPQPGSNMPYVSGIASPAQPAAPRPTPVAPASPQPPRPTTAGVPFAEDLYVNGLPLLKPPYGTISAIDMDTGAIVWTVPNGETPEFVRDHPALQGLDIPRTGRDGFVAPVVTDTLLIVGEPSFGPTPSGRRGAMLRAYDKHTGNELGAVYMPAPQSGSPISYMADGRQYIVVAVSGAGYPGALIAYRVPDPMRPSLVANSYLPRPAGADMSGSVWDGVYTSAQAQRGSNVYASLCAACHGGGLEGLEMAPPLSGPNFTQNWNGQSLASLVDRIRAMPPETPGLVGAEDSIDVLSYILERAGFPAAEDALPVDRNRLGDIRFTSLRPL
jgi:quinoprotein glucose dehydrogenase